MSRITITIDGRDAEVTEGMTIIDAAESAGVHIPNLCYLKGMKGVGACRLCLVEVEGLKAPVIACNTRVKDGMVVRTKTDRIQEIRKFVIDLLLSMHPLDCLTCPKAGQCDLQQYAYDFGLKGSSFRKKQFGYPIDSANPFVRRDPNYCILCGRCVRVCKEQGTSVLEFMGRGVESKVVTAGDKPLQESTCTFCGSCLDVCPVNALMESGRVSKGREWEMERTRSVCLACGNSCDIVVSTKDGLIQKVNAGAAEGSVERFICAYGRYGYDGVISHSRITVPMKRVEGKLIETTWDDALAVVAEHLRRAGSEAGFLCSADITNEDALALKTFAKDIVRTKNVDSTVSAYGDTDFFLSSHRANIDEADLIILVDLDPSQWERVLPALDAAVRRRVNRGAKLVTIGESGCRIGEVADLRLEGNVTSILRRIAKALIDKGFKAHRAMRRDTESVNVTEEIEKAAALIEVCRDLIIFVSASYFRAAANLTLLKGSIVCVPLESNARGISLMGLGAEGKSYPEMVKGGMRALYVVGNVPLSERPATDFLVVQNSHFTPLARQADVVLPSAFSFETTGTIYDYLGRLKQLHRAVEPYMQAKMHRNIFIELARAMGASLHRPTESDVKKTARVKMKIGFSPFVKEEQYMISPRAFLETIHADLIQNSRLIWLKEVEKTSAA